MNPPSRHTLIPTLFLEAVVNGLDVGGDDVQAHGQGGDDAFLRAMYSRDSMRHGAFIPLS